MIVGVDFSLTSTGVCALIDGVAECVTIKSKKEEAWWEFPERVQSIGYQIAEWAQVGGDSVDGWVIESPAFLAKGQLDRMFGGWWMVIEVLMRDYDWPPPLRVTPTQVKKFATNNGNANKDEVLAAVIRRYPDVLVAGNDQADALVLAAIGAGVERASFQAVTAFQQKVIDDVRKRDIGETK